jgi:hypothetical protein
MPGPYHRVETPTQTVADALQQVASSEIWGKAAKPGGLYPCVKAYPGALAAGKRGIDFTTTTAPDPFSSSPIELRWYYPRTPGVVLRIKLMIDYACIDAIVVNKQP